MSISRATLYAAAGLVFTTFLYAQTGTHSEPPAPPSAAPAIVGVRSGDYSQEAYVIEDLKESYRFESDGTGQREVQGRVRVQSEAGIQQWGQLVVGYSSGNERLEFRYVRVRKPDGSVVTAGADAVQDLTGPVAREAPVYTDFHEKHLSVPGLRPGDTLEYDIITTIEKPLAANQFWMDHDFDKTSIVLSEVLEVNIPKFQAVKLKAKPELPAAERVEGDRKIYRWATSHLVREDDDKNKDDPEKAKRKLRKRRKDAEQPDIQMTTFANWEQVGQWYESLERDRRTPSPEVRAKVAQLIAGKTTDLDKIEALYDYVGPNIRYVSLSLGVGRYQPHAASEVLANQYGDCKDKHTLLAAMLEAIGFHASSVLINSARKLDPDVPSPAQFDHVITLLPLGKDDVWMDTTAEIAPFRLLAFQLRNKQALVVPPDGKGVLRYTPADPPIPDLQLEEIDGKIGDLGKLTATVHLTMRGDNELVLRSIFRRVPNAQWIRVLENMNALAGIAGEVTAVTIGAPAATHVPYEITYTISKVNYLDWTRKKSELSLPLSQFISLQDADDDDSSDAEPVKLGPPGEYIYKLKLQFPKDYTARLPVPFTLKRDYAEYSAEYKMDGGILIGNRHLSVLQREIPAARARDYLNFRHALEADLTQQVAMETTTAGSAATAGNLKPDDLDQAGYDALESGNYTTAVDLLKRTVEADPKHKAAWIHLGRAYLALRQTDLAIAAFKKQLEVNPYDEYANNELGRAYWLQRKYEDAAAAFHKQLEQNPLDKYAHGALGSMYSEWHKYAEAAPELEKAVSLTPDDSSYQVSLGDAYLNLGQDDKALTAFDRAVELAPVPETWNNIAFQLSEKKTHLDKAQQYAESAVTSVEASLRNVSLAKVTQRELTEVVSISAYWDTLGWVYFVQGNLEKAQKYIRASWETSQRGEVGDHLGQIFEAEGDKASAMGLYALALKGDRPEAETRVRLKKLAGDKEAERLELAAGDLATAGRTYNLKLSKPWPKGDDAAQKDQKGVGSGSAVSGLFWLLVGPGGKVEDVRAVEGDSRLSPIAADIKSLTLRQTYPDNGEVRLVRQASVQCKDAAQVDCTLVLVSAEAAQAQ